MNFSNLLARKRPIRRSAIQPKPGNADSRDLRPAGGVGSASAVLRSIRLSQNAPRACKRQKRVLRFGKIPQNPEFLAFVRTLPCILTGKTGYATLGTPRQVFVHQCSGRIEASHVGRSGMRIKAADETCLPMCSRGHRTGPLAHHKISSLFWSAWGLNKQVLVEQTQQKAREAGIHVAEGVVL